MENFKELIRSIRSVKSMDMSEEEYFQYCDLKSELDRKIDQFNKIKISKKQLELDNENKNKKRRRRRKRRIHISSEKLNLQHQNKIIIHGVEENEKDIANLWNLLEVNINNSNKYYKLGHKPTSPLVIELQRGEKRRIYKNLGKLKAVNNIKIFDFLTPGEREERKKFSELIRRAKADGHKVYFRGIILFINGIPIDSTNIEKYLKAKPFSFKDLALKPLNTFLTSHDSFVLQTNEQKIAIKNASIQCSSDFAEKAVQTDVKIEYNIHKQVSTALTRSELEEEKILRQRAERIQKEQQQKIIQLQEQIKAQKIF